MDFSEKYCRPCGAWCCRGEEPFTDSKEAAVLGVERIGQRAGGECQYLAAGRCRRYSDRPFECRIFPFDIQDIDGVYTWVLWSLCPGHSSLDPECGVVDLEVRLLPVLSPGYIKKYVDHHRQRQPAKYDQGSYRIIRPVKGC